MEPLKVLPADRISSAYGRSVAIWLEDADCHVCGQPAPCISIDTSDDEYGPGYICKSCIDNAYARMKAAG